MFIYSLPILFVQMHWGSPQEFLIVTLFFLIVLYIVTPYDSFFEETDWGRFSELTLYKYLFDSWTGQVKLWLVFWPFFILLNLSLLVTDHLAKISYFTVSSWDEIHFMILTPTVFWIIAVWRSALNTCSRFWAIAARFITLAVIFEFLLKLEIRREYPRIFFECQELALDYAACF